MNLKYYWEEEEGGGQKLKSDWLFGTDTPPPPDPRVTRPYYDIYIRMAFTIQYSVFETVAHLMLCNTSSDALEKNSLIKYSLLVHSGQYRVSLY